MYVLNGILKYHLMQIPYKFRMNNNTKKLVVYKAMPTKVHVFIDLDSVEVFADDGRWTGTVRIPDGGIGSKVDSVEVTCEKIAKLPYFLPTFWHSLNGLQNGTHFLSSI